MQLSIEPNNGLAIYDQLVLQNEQVLQSLRGRGMAVCADAKSRCVSDRQQLLAERLDTVVDEALRSGLEPRQLREMFESSVAKFWS